jgi:hypothetical protein
MKKLFGLSFQSYKFWLHYILLTAGVFLLHEISMIIKLEDPSKIALLFVFYLIGLWLIDQSIHKVLGVD